MWPEPVPYTLRFRSLTFIQLFETFELFHCFRKGESFAGAAISGSDVHIGTEFDLDVFFDDLHWRNDNVSTAVLLALLGAIECSRFFVEVLEKDVAEDGRVAG